MLRLGWSESLYYLAKRGRGFMGEGRRKLYSAVAKGRGEMALALTPEQYEILLTAASESDLKSLLAKK